MSRQKHNRELSAYLFSEVLAGLYIGKKIMIDPKSFAAVVSFPRRYNVVHLKSRSQTFDGLLAEADVAEWVEEHYLVFALPKRFITASRNKSGFLLGVVVVVRTARPSTQKQPRHGLRLFKHPVFAPTTKLPLLANAAR